MPETETPAATLRRAAALMRERAKAAASDDWPGVPWKVTECTAPDLADPSQDECPCIVYQGEYAPLTESQVPPIQYVADAESPEHAAHIASWHPAVALAVAGWLEKTSREFEANVSARLLCRQCGGWHDDRDPDDRCHCWDAALAIARAYLGEVPRG